MNSKKKAPLTLLNPRKMQTGYVYGFRKGLSHKVFTDAWNKWRTTVYRSGVNGWLKLLRDPKNL